MRIERITDIDEVIKCIPFEQEIRNKGRDNTRISKMLLFVRDQLTNPLFGFWIAYDNEDEVIGYSIAVLSLIPSMERIHLLRIYAKQKELKEQFEEILTNWAKEYKIKVAQMTATKHIRAFERRYKWKVVSVNMERRI